MSYKVLTKTNAGDAGDMGLIPGSGKSLEKEMKTHSSILARIIPQTMEPGRLQSLGSQRVRHDCSTECACTHAIKLLVKYCDDAESKRSWMFAPSVGMGMYLMDLRIERAHHKMVRDNRTVLQIEEATFKEHPVSDPDSKDAEEDRLAERLSSRKINFFLGVGKHLAGSRAQG